MNRKFVFRLTVLAALAGALSGCGNLAHSAMHGDDHPHGDMMQSGMMHGDGANMHGHDDEHGMMSDHDDDHHEGGGHRHDRWIDPPADYQTQALPDWNDKEAAERGKVLYSQYCQSCHGSDGEGDGPAAAGLSHKPADLNNHFHGMFRHSDHYLFWRISEGGQAEPFKSEGSAMPAFRNVLTPQQRWDVLTYVHQKFHEGQGHSE